MQRTVWGRKGRSEGGGRGITCTPATTMRPALKNMDDSTMHMSGSCIQMRGAVEGQDQ